MCVLMSVVKNFLIRVITRSKRGSLLDLLLTGKEKLVRDVKANGSLGCSNHELGEFKILREASKMNNNYSNPRFRKSKCWLFQGLLGKIPG